MEVQNFDKSKKETFKILCNIKLLYESYLSDNYKKIFVDKLNENPIRYIISDKSFNYDKIKNFYTWQDYFMYMPSEGSKKLLLINKKDILRVLNNIRTSIINDTKLNKIYKLN